MNDLIKINGIDITVKEHKGERVCTFKDIDTLHKRREGTSGRNFRENRARLKEGEDYFRRNSSEAKSEYGITAPSGLILLTETGYLMLTKSMTDDLSWEVQRMLVNNYFVRKQEMLPAFQEVPGFCFTKEDLDNIIREERELIFKLDHPAIYRQYGASQTSLFGASQDDWRMRINENISRIAEKTGGKAVERFVLDECFECLERRFHCNLARRVRNIKADLLLNGRSLPLTRQIGKIDAISADKRLREQFNAIVKDLAQSIGVEAI